MTLQNFDFTNQNFQQELETCANKNHVKTENEKLKLDLEKYYDTRIMTFIETITIEVDDKFKTLKLYIDRLINEIKDTVGEFKINITHQWNEFISNHKSVLSSICEIRNLQSEFRAQKKEILNAIQEYKCFHEDENIKAVESDYIHPNIIKTIDEELKAFCDGVISNNNKSDVAEVPQDERFMKIPEFVNHPKIKNINEEIETLRSEIQNSKATPNITLPQAASGSS